MSQNHEPRNPQQQKSAQKEKKDFPFFKSLLSLLVVGGLGFAAYYAINPKAAVQSPTNPQSPQQKENTFTLDTLINDPEKALNALTDTISDTYNKITSDETVSKLTENAKKLYDETTDKIRDVITPTKNKQNQTNTDASQNLTEEDMQTGKLTSASSQTQDTANTESSVTPDWVNNQQTANTTAQSVQPNQQLSQNQTSKPNQSDSSEFSLEPPKNIPPLESGRRMLTDEEIAEARAKHEQEQLAQLNALRSQENTYTTAELNALPGTEGTLSNLSPESMADPVITPFFIHDLADFLVKSYIMKADKNSVAKPSLRSLNQRYGVGLHGLEHGSGRLGVLKYAYNENMIPVLYNHFSMPLIESMQQLASQKGLSAKTQQNMFANYAAISSQYAHAIDELNNIPQLSENINNLIVIEDSLKDEEDFFAKNLQGFEQNKTNKDLARTYEKNIKDSTIRMEQLRGRVKNVKAELQQYLQNYDEKLADMPEILDLALWLERRKNPSANAALARSLNDFSRNLMDFSKQLAE